MDEIVKKVKGIHGLMTIDELAVLCRMARSADSIAELGCYKGRSLIAMGLSNPDAKLYGIDFFGDMSHRGYKGSTLEETQENLRSRGVKAEFYVGTTDEVADQFDREIDLLHIDAGHSYDECMNDLNNYTPKIIPGGAVCIHDYGQARKDCLDRPEVKEAVDDWHKANPDWVEVERAGTMIAFRHTIAQEGVLYVAYGEKAVENVENSIETLAERISAKPIAVITDAKAVKGADILIRHVDLDPGARNIKTRIYSLSPFYKTFYLDADTEVWDDPQHGFDLLEKVDLVMGQDTVKIFNRNHHPHMVKEEMTKSKQETGGGEYCYYNTGVMFFTRNDRMKKLMQAWHQEWKRWERQDQPAFFRSMFNNPVRIAAMRQAWNTHRSKDAKFVFHAHRRASRDGAPK
jgi:predicted O-methyltransferase YrrM